ncbi:MAG: hypothetical protein Ct9H300mP19_15460 [Dehalococcoidia bacterium]|nr:MAG: hypothetical protein Ct9H300mP19_15460 [Dehalococcoidia bacterium]
MASGLEWIPSVVKSTRLLRVHIHFPWFVWVVYLLLCFTGLSRFTWQGCLIASELGIRVTDENGEAIDWSTDMELPAVVVGWPKIHDQLIAAM